VLSQGADCVTSLSGKHEELNLDQFIDFLEPQPEKINPDGTKTPERGAAVCLSADDWIALKTAIQQLCEKVGSFCTKEVKQEIAQVNSNVDDLQKRVMRKKKTIKPKGA
jgi:hypothetical protein